VTGHDFSVWAPRPREVRLVVDGVRVALERTAGGWWRPEPDPRLADLGGDVDYGYLLDGEGPFPDPRSRRQPRGVHELSRTWDADGHEWSDSAWTGRQLAGGVIYELHVGTFTAEGTLRSATSRLDHLVELGIDFVELLPVNAFSGRHNWGYDGVAWFAVHEGYGGPDAYQDFVDACHAHGLGVIQDVVYNHLGPSGNVLPRFGPYLNDAELTTWGESVNLDGPGSDEVRRYIIDNALFWLRDMHVDGLRLDAVHALRDSRAVPLLAELSAEVDALSATVRRPLSLIAETDRNDPATIAPRGAGGAGLGMTTQWSDDFHHALHSTLTGETSGYYADFHGTGVLAQALRRGFVHDGTFSSFRGRHHGAPLDTSTTPAWRLVVCTQNHDQVGNRATGDRPSAVLGPRQLALAATVLLLSPFTPMLFMGEEWGATTPWQFFTDHSEPELASAVREGRTAEFSRMGWDPELVPDPQDPATFERSKLDWRLSPENQRLLRFYHGLIALRRREPTITDPRLDRLDASADASGRVLVVGRPGFALAVNTGANAASARLPEDAAAWHPAVVVGDVEGEGGAVTLEPHSALAVTARGHQPVRF